MNFLFKKISAIALSLSAATALAAPAKLVTHNNTDDESNAFVAGTPSIYPTQAHATRGVEWNLVKIACYGHSVNRICPAVIKMKTNTPSPVEIGTVKMNLDSGEITPATITANGYTFIVNGPGEATIVKN